jgi:hypothetical protein
MPPATLGQPLQPAGAPARPESKRGSQAAASYRGRGALYDAPPGAFEHCTARYSRPDARDP